MKEGFRSYSGLSETLKAKLDDEVARAARDGKTEFSGLSGEILRLWPRLADSYKRGQEYGRFVVREDELRSKGVPEEVLSRGRQRYREIVDERQKLKGEIEE